MVEEDPVRKQTTPAPAIRASHSRIPSIGSGAGVPRPSSQPSLDQLPSSTRASFSRLSLQVGDGPQQPSLSRAATPRSPGTAIPSLRGSFAGNLDLRASAGNAEAFTDGAEAGVRPKDVWASESASKRSSIHVAVRLRPLRCSSSCCFEFSGTACARQRVHGRQVTHPTLHAATRSASATTRQHGALMRSRT